MIPLIDAITAALDAKDSERAYFAGWNAAREACLVEVYGYRPCPICRGIEGCDHTTAERIRALKPPERT